MGPYCSTSNINLSNVTSKLHHLPPFHMHIVCECTISVIRFATVYQRFYCHKFCAATNQICRYKPNELALST